MDKKAIDKKIITVKTITIGQTIVIPKGTEILGISAKGHYLEEDFVKDSGTKLVSLVNDSIHTGANWTDFIIEKSGTEGKLRAHTATPPYLHKLLLEQAIRNGDKVITEKKEKMNGIEAMMLGNRRGQN